MMPAYQTRLTRPLAPSPETFLARMEQMTARAWYTNHGPLHDELEGCLCKRLKCPNLTLFANGTLALVCALEALGLKGDILTTPFTFPATTQAIRRANLRPVFCDLEPKGLNLDPYRLDEYLTPETTAILAVHVFGSPCDCEALEEFADQKGLRLVFDAAHAFDLTHNGQSIGTYGDISMFSFHATKLFHTAEGGCLVYRDPSLAEKLRLLQNFGIPSEDRVATLGTNAKLSEPHAALGLSVLERVDEERAKRLRLTRMYDELFAGADGLRRLPEEIADETPALQYFTLIINPELFGCSRDEIHGRLTTSGIHARKYFNPLCCDFDCSTTSSAEACMDFPVARTAAEQTICLPLYGDLPFSELERIAQIVLDKG